MLLFDKFHTKRDLQPSAWGHFESEEMIDYKTMSASAVVQGMDDFRLEIHVVMIFSDMDNGTRCQIRNEFNQFRAIRSMEIAHANIDRLELEAKCARQGIRIRELTLEFERAQAPVVYIPSNKMYHT
jgi:hypothetical protein